MKDTIRILAICWVVLIGGLGNGMAQTFDISSGGLPTITGAINGSVAGSADVLTDLVVTVNFGEVSPINTNNVVRVVVPIAIRSTLPYQVTASVSGGANANMSAIQPSDIGIGFQNMRPLGGQAGCFASNHIIYPPFNLDPAANALINAAGRVYYPASLQSLAASPVILTGPRLTRNSNATRNRNDGYIFDAVLALTPGFYANSGSTATITFRISAGPAVPC